VKYLAMVGEACILTENMIAMAQIVPLYV